MQRKALALIALTMVSGCAAATHNAAAEHQGVVVNAVHTPIDLAGPITLDRAVQLAIERHPIASSDSAPVPEAERFELARTIRHRTTEAYAQYVRASMDEHVHADAVHLIDTVAALARARAAAASISPIDRDMIQLEQARLHLAVRSAAHDLELARASLNVELSRAPDAPLGAPSETAPMTIDAGLDDLVTRAMHTRQVLGHAVPEHVVRGEVAVAQQHLAQLTESWRVFEAEAMPPATALMQGLQTAYTSGQINLSTLAQDLRLAFQTPLERASRIAEVMAAAGELEWVVGEPLIRVAVPTSAPAAAAAAPEAAAAPVETPASAAPAATAPVSTAPASAAPHGHTAAPHGAAPHTAPHPAH